MTAIRRRCAVSAILVPSPNVMTYLLTTPFPFSHISLLTARPLGGVVALTVAIYRSRV